MEGLDGSGVFHFLSQTFCCCCCPIAPLVLDSSPLGVGHQSQAISRTLWPVHSQAHKPFLLTGTGSRRRNPAQLREQLEGLPTSPSPLGSQTRHRGPYPEEPPPQCLSAVFIPVTSHLSLMSCVEMCKPFPGRIAFANWQYKLDHK